MRAYGPLTRIPVARVTRMLRVKQVLWTGAPWSGVILQPPPSSHW